MTRPFRHRLTAIFAVLLTTLAACATPEVAKGINDPYEAQNRRVHETNRAIDKALLRPGAQGYGKVIPEPVQQGIGNFASNIGQPSAILNDVLQANIEDAAFNFTRFLINSTFGIAGIFDPASSMGLFARPSDFGETLYVWGAREGKYVELPLLGPSTERDAIGRFVDLLIDPVNFLLPSPERYVGTVAGVASSVGDRYRFGTTIDSVLYDSADSYAQARLLYLEQRRFQLGGASEDDYFDPYADPFAQ